MVVEAPSHPFPFSLYCSISTVSITSDQPLSLFLTCPISRLFCLLWFKKKKDTVVGWELSATETYPSVVDSAALRPCSSRRCVCWGPTSWHTDGAYDLVTAWHDLGRQALPSFPSCLSSERSYLTGCFVYQNLSFLVCFVVSCVHLILIGRPWCTLSQTLPGHDCWPLVQKATSLSFSVSWCLWLWPYEWCRLYQSIACLLSALQLRQTSEFFKSRGDSTLSVLNSETHTLLFPVACGSPSGRWLVSFCLVFKQFLSSCLVTLSSACDWSSHSFIHSCIHSPPLPYSILPSWPWLVLNS